MWGQGLNTPNKLRILMIVFTQVGKGTYWHVFFSVRSWQGGAMMSP